MESRFGIGGCMFGSVDGDGVIRKEVGRMIEVEFVWWKYLSGNENDEYYCLIKEIFNYCFFGSL